MEGYTVYTKLMTANISKSVGFLGLINVNNYLTNIIQLFQR